MSEQEVGGWFLPGKDSYFPRFVEGAAAKKNGFQRDHLEAAFNYVKAWDVAIDVGAHCGFWAVPMGQRFARVYAFEPAEDCFVCLQKNVSELPNVQTFNAAVGDTPGHCILKDDFRKPSNTGARFVRKTDEGPTPMVALDELGFLACDLLKVDVEGFELPVLVGARKTIKRYRPVIIMETDKNFSWDRYKVPKNAAEEWLLAQCYKVVEHMRPDKVFVPG